MALTLTVCFPGKRVGKGLGLASVPALTYDTPLLVIGRGETCEFRLPDVSVSHRHATIRQRGPKYVIVDEGSTNGTYLGSERLQPHAQRNLRTGDLLRLGRVFVEVAIDPSRAVTANSKSIHQLALKLLRTGIETADPKWSESLSEEELDVFLSDLEAREDEVMADDEKVGSPIPRIPKEEPSIAPLAEAREPPRARPVIVAEPRVSFGASDALILLLALFVLAGSLAGLFWILK